LQNEENPYYFLMGIPYEKEENSTRKTLFFHSSCFPIVR
jgi:hypothetical protein